MRNYKQVDTEAGEEVRIRKRDIFACAFALAAVSFAIWALGV